jgi:hypothetical protein
VLQDAERLIAAWNERQARRMPMLFSPTIGAAMTAGYWFLWVRCPACRTTNAIDLRRLDRHRAAAVSSLIPALSCRSYVRFTRESGHWSALGCPLSTNRRHHWASTRNVKLPSILWVSVDTARQFTL